MSANRSFSTNEAHVTHPSIYSNILVGLHKTAKILVVQDFRLFHAASIVINSIFAASWTMWTLPSKFDISEHWHRCGREESHGRLEISTYGSAERYFNLPK